MCWIKDEPRRGNQDDAADLNVRISETISSKLADFLWKCFIAALVLPFSTRCYHCQTGTVNSFNLTLKLGGDRQRPANKTLSTHSTRLFLQLTRSCISNFCAFTQYARCTFLCRHMSVCLLHTWCMKADNIWKSYIYACVCTCVNSCELWVSCLSSF